MVSCSTFIIIYNAEAIPFFIRLESSDRLKFFGLTLNMPPVVAPDPVFSQKDFVPPRKIALCGWLFLRACSCSLAKSTKKGTNKPKICSRFLHNKPPHSFFFSFLVLLGLVIQSHKTFLAKWRLYFPFLSSRF